MTDSDEILSVLGHNSCSLSQLYNMLILPKNIIRGRLHELYKKGLVRKFNGKFAITSTGLDQIESLNGAQYNFLITKTNASTKIHAKSENNAQQIAKLIYGTDYKVIDIGTK